MTRSKWQKGSTRHDAGLLHALEASFEAASRTSEGKAEPVVLLWPDPEEQWRPLVAQLRKVLPHVYTLGVYNTAERTGPAIWMRCIVDGTLPDACPKDGVMPILYLPGVSRQDLRAGEACPRAIQPLCELQYRGCVWHQKGGRDWTVFAFLTSEEGLGLDIAEDAKTREALLRALPLFMDAPVGSLTRRRLESDDFDRLAVSDPTRDLLRWMGLGETFRSAGDENRWHAFCGVCLSDFGFDPDKKPPADAATRLVTGGGPWEAVWQRFREAPKLYPGVSDLLRDVKGQFGLAYDRERTPLVNETAEKDLRNALGSLGNLPHASAIEKVAVLEAEHGHRRGWVWAETGESPLALALEPLARIAACAKWTHGGATVSAAIAAYVSHGWKCDSAAIEALEAAVAPADVALIHAAVKALYGPWLDASARHFQTLVAAAAGNTRAQVSGTVLEKGACVLFADGLRFDIACLLKERLLASGLRVQLGHRLSPFPTVTATAKPFASTVYDALEGGDDTIDFNPRLRDGSQVATAQRLRDLMAKRGMDILGDDHRSPRKGTAGAWVEAGQLDKLGHKLGAKLALHLDLELRTIVDKITNLLDAGWPQVQVVTDHGWLLLPGGLPRVDLPSHSTATKWARCATIKGEVRPEMPVQGWHWNTNVHIASPPGIACFTPNNEYAHGGVSPQECIVPELVVERGGDKVAATIMAITWRGMRCRVTVATNDPSVHIDLRLNWKQPGSSIALAPKEAGARGEVSLAVPDDSHESAAVMVVVVDAAGNVLDRKPTTVGEAK